MQVYRGRITTPEDPDRGLTTVLKVGVKELTVSTENEVLGSYPLRQVAVERVAGDRFLLKVAGEDLVFTSDDAAAFTYEAIPFIQRESAADARREGLRNLVRNLLAGAEPERAEETAPANGSVVAAEAGPVEAAATEPPVLVEAAPPADVVVATVAEAVPKDVDEEIPGDTVEEHGLDLASARRLLERALVDVEHGRLKPDRALAMAHLVRAICETLRTEEPEHAPQEAVLTGS